MLVLSRKANEGIRISDDIEVVVLEVRGNIVKLGIKAPRELSVVRTELCQQAKGDPPDHGPQTSVKLPRERSLISAADEACEQLLHQFCERRTKWRMPDAVQALCVSAMAPLVAAGSIAGTG